MPLLGFLRIYKPKREPESTRSQMAHPRVISRRMMYWLHDPISLAGSGVQDYWKWLDQHLCVLVALHYIYYMNRTSVHQIKIENDYSIHNAYWRTYWLASKKLCLCTMGQCPVILVSYYCRSKAGWHIITFVICLIYGPIDHMTKSYIDQYITTLVVNFLTSIMDVCYTPMIFCWCLIL